MRGPVLFRFALAAGLACCAVPILAAQPRAADVAHALAARLPRTKVTRIDCRRLPGICEVVAGTNIFYVDPGARYLIVGRVYDLATHQDLTAARLLEIDPDTVLGSASSSRGSGEAALAGQARGVSGEAALSAAPQKLSLASLPPSGGIEWGGAAQTRFLGVTVFSDFHCGYCRQLHQTLKAMGVRVTERPISILGTRAISEAVICAADRPEAIDKAYTDQEVTKRACDTSGLDANEAFARDHGFTGTPVLVRQDGAVVLGFRPREFLEAWLKGGA